MWSDARAEYLTASALLEGIITKIATITLLNRG